MGVEIVECMHKLLSYLPDLGLRQVPIIFQDFEKLSLGELSNNAELMRCLE